MSGQAEEYETPRAIWRELSKEKLVGVVTEQSGTIRRVRKVNQELSRRILELEARVRELETELQQKELFSRAAAQAVIGLAEHRDRLVAERTPPAYSESASATVPSATD